MVRNTVMNNLSDYYDVYVSDYFYKRPQFDAMHKIDYKPFCNDATSLFRVLFTEFKVLESEYILNHRNTSAHFRVIFGT